MFGHLGIRLFIIILFAFSLVACTTEEAEDVNDINKQTLLVFMPWSGSLSDNGLYSYFQQNLDSIETAILRQGNMVGRVLVFLSTSPSESSLYEITNEGRQIQHVTLNTYSGNLYTTAEGIARILNDVQTNAFALNYALIIGCHGCGWTFKSDWQDYPNNARASTSLSDSSETPNSQFTKFNAQGSKFMVAAPLTRFYGSVSDNDYSTDIDILAQGIAAAGMKFQYILFDDCYMANVETAYELKDVTNFLVASTSEVLAIGMPYQTMWSSLASQTPNYSSAVNAFGNFYRNYSYPFGALSAIDCRKLDTLASLMKNINERYTLADSLRDSLQVLDGFHTPLFYDLGDYVSRLCQNTDMLNDFDAALSSAVKATFHTDTLYSHIYNQEDYKLIDVKHYSGLTISDPSQSGVAIRGREKTAWWRDTHQ